MTAGSCWALDCLSTDTRRYLNGPACDQHAPWAHAGRPAPWTQVDPARTDAAMRISSASTWVMGGTDIDKTRPGGYVSRQRAIKLAAERDALSTLQHQPTERKTA